MRLGIRSRLTLIYVMLFFVAGAALIGLNYVLVSRTAFQPLTAADLQQEKAVLAQGDLGRANQFEDALRARLREQTLNQLVSNSAAALGLFAIVSLGLGWVVAGHALHPVAAVTLAAKRASNENLRERIKLQGPRDELKELADTFDAMLARLDAAFENQERFAANASHELRTPLAIIRTAVDVVLGKPHPSQSELRKMHDEVTDASVRAEGLIDSLLMLARSDRGPAARTRVDLRKSMVAALEAVEGEVRKASLQVTSTLAPAPVAGDQVLLDRMVANLVENAARHNAQGGWLDVETSVDLAYANVRVANGGPRIPADQVATLVEPFRRLSDRTEDSPRGAGLGLSIVRSVVRTHGGDVNLRALPEGGLEVAVRIPTAT